MIDTDKYEGHDNWDGTKINMNNEANVQLIADAPLLLEHVKRLTKTLELIGKNMEYNAWMHTLIKDVIGYERVIE